MRTWHIILIPHLCPKHLSGLHFEIHKHRHNFEKHHSITGRIHPIVQIEPERMQILHDECAKYLKNHASPYTMPDLSYLTPEERFAKVDLAENIETLTNRCIECKNNLIKGGF